MVIENKSTRKGRSSKFQHQQSACPKKMKLVGGSITYGDEIGSGKILNRISKGHLGRDPNLSTEMVEKELQVSTPDPSSPGQQVSFQRSHFLLKLGPIWKSTNCKAALRGYKKTFLAPWEELFKLLDLVKHLMIRST